MQREERNKLTTYPIALAALPVKHVAGELRPMKALVT
jgi:hypothetical protein